MTTPFDVHSMGSTVRKELAPLRDALALSRRRRASRAGIENPEPVSAYKKRDGNKRIVTYVEQVAAEHGPRDGAHVRENDAYENE
jgi:hypothetical protein